MHVQCCTNIEAGNYIISQIVGLIFPFFTFMNNWLIENECPISWGNQVIFLFDKLIGPFFQLHDDSWGSRDICKSTLVARAAKQDASVFNTKIIINKIFSYIFYLQPPKLIKNKPNKPICYSVQLGVFLRLDYFSSVGGMKMNPISFNDRKYLKEIKF